MDRLRQLIHEIHRRSLWQVLLIYVGASWAVLQVVDTVAGALQLPDWVEPVALVLLIVGLPIVLATAFVQEGGPGHDRAVSEAEDPEAPATARGLLTWRNAFGGGVLAFALWGVVAAGWVMFGGATRDATYDGSGIEPSIAVMPCDDLSPTQDQAALAQGLAEEVSLALSGLDGMEKVSGRSSTLVLKSQGADLATIASTLNVANVLNCTVARSAEQVRVTAELTEAATGAILWSDGFQEPLTDLFAVYDVIARGVADGLRLALTGGDNRSIVTQATQSAEAHEAYLRGRFFWNQRGTNLLDAVDEFETALEFDPQYAEALSGLADSYALLDTRERALELAERAVALAPDLGMARTSLGYAQLRLGAWDGAEREFRHAIRLNPGYATAHHWYGVLLYFTGRADQAVVQIGRALELDPVSRAANRDLAGALWSDGRLREAEVQLRTAIELDRDYRVAQSNLLQVLILAGTYDEVRDTEWMGLIDPDPAITRELMAAVMRYSETGEAQSYEIPSDYPLGELPRARLYAATGQTERVLPIVENLSRQGDFFRLAGAHAMTGQLLADNPRYQALLDEAGITW